MSKARDILNEPQSAHKVAGDTDIKKGVERLLKLTEEMDNLKADLKAVYDEYADKGVDRRALKTVVKLKRKDMSEEHKNTVNAYLRALGELPLFAGVTVQ
jgi:uncharacterized protein (UPF0335 family)